MPSRVCASRRGTADHRAGDGRSMTPRQRSGHSASPRPRGDGVQAMSRRRPRSAASSSARSLLRSSHRPDPRSAPRLRTAREDGGELGQVVAGESEPVLPSGLVGVEREHHHMAKARREVSPCHSQHIARRGACRKARVTVQNRRPMPQPAEMGARRACVVVGVRGCGDVESEMRSRALGAALRGWAPPDSSEARERGMRTCSTRGAADMEAPVIRSAAARQRSTTVSEVAQ